MSQCPKCGKNEYGPGPFYDQFRWIGCNACGYGFKDKNQMPKTTVVNIRNDKYDIYCGRAGKGMEGTWGNNHRVGFCSICNTVHRRGEAISAFKKDFDKRIQEDPEFREKVLELRGKKLGCFCAPQPCHCDVYADYLNNLKD